MRPNDVPAAFGYPRPDGDHVWGWCDVCGQPSLVTKATVEDEKRPRCRMTPRCEGRHIPRAGA